ncbi:AAA family ATPase [Streptomyces sp. NPDC093225]|uniref:AAA family ATPase n=1 Tax=Streptomyces sp. NPDC093225 TaxID=3366034 RepID=UPI0038059F5A
MPGGGAVPTQPRRRRRGAPDGPGAPDARPARLRLATTVRAVDPALRQGAPWVTDLRGREDESPGPERLEFAAGDLVVVSGLPGGGKSTLIKRTAPGRVVDSQDARERWQRRMPARLPYAGYRPLVRIAHYAGLWRVLRSGESVVVHDCGSQPWVRRSLARAARRRGRSLHLVLLDASPEEALSGQLARGRGVTGYAFTRHRRTVARLLSAAEQGTPPPGCASVTLLDRRAATRLTSLSFTAPAPRPGPAG